MSPDGFGGDWVFRCVVCRVCVPLLMCTCLIDGKLMVDDTCCLTVRLCDGQKQNLMDSDWGRQLIPELGTRHTRHSWDTHTLSRLVCLLDSSIPSPVCLQDVCGTISMLHFHLRQQASLMTLYLRPSPQSFPLQSCRGQPLINRECSPSCCFSAPFLWGTRKCYRYKHLSSSPPSSPVRLPVEGGDVRRLVWSTTDSSPTQQSPRQSLGREGWWQGTRLDMSQREWVASCYWSCLSGAHRSAQGTYSVLDLRVKTFNTLTNSGCFS